MRSGSRGRVLLAVLVVTSTATLGSTSANASANHAPGEPTALTVDDDAAPLAVEGEPQFGWVVNDGDRGEVQTAYQLVVQEVQLGGGSGRDVWDSGKVRSRQQSYVTDPKHLALEPDHSYTWKVRTWDREGSFGSFSKPATFDVGLGDRDWRADWIRRRGAPQTPLQDFSLVRKEIPVSASPIVRARAYMSAGQQYDLRVNGARVAHGPSFAYPDEQYYEATDLTQEFKPGRRNVIGVITHWSTPGQGRPASVPAMIAHISIDHADGTRQVITSDATWRTQVGPWSQGPPRNDEGDFVEVIDGRRDPVGWDRTGFDDSAWPHAEELGRHPVAPFRHLFAARSHIVEQPVKPVKVTGMSNGAFVADYGAVFAATPEVELRNGVAGRGVTIVAGYLLDPDGHVSTTKGTQQTDMHWDYVERAGAQVFRPFDYLGFRYLVVIGADEQLTPDELTEYARHASVPDTRAARFSSSNPELDKVWDLLRRSALYATQEQFLDTPTREKGAFQDPNTSSATMAAFGDRAMTYQALRDVARSQKRYWPDGRVNNVYPNGDGKRDIPDATEQYVDWVWQTYMTTGNVAQLSALFPVVKNISDYVAEAIDPRTGLVTNLPGGGSDYLYGLVDWPPQMRYGYDMKTVARTTENVLAVDVFRLVAAMCVALNRPTGERFDELTRAADLTAAIHSRLRRRDGVFVDGLEASGAQSPHASQIANAYALSFGLVPSHQMQTVAAYIVSLGNSIGVSTYGYLLTALHRAGRDAAFVTSLTDPSRPGYAQILREGATYSWESWDARQTGDSESHAFGSNVLTILQEDVLGVKVTSAGASRIEIQTPAITPMRVAGVAATQRGRVPIAWSRSSAGRFSLQVTIPANVEAAIHVPAETVGDVSDGHSSLEGDPGVLSARPAGGEVVVTVGSGEYELHVPALEPLPTESSHWHVTVLLVIVLAILFAAVAATAVMTVMRVRRRRRGPGSA